MFKHLLIIFFGLGLATPTFAEEAYNDTCAQANARNQQNLPIYFLQYSFKDGTRDLALSQSIPAKSSEIKRVTFEHAKNCVYQALAIAEGQNWGWHLAWADAQKIYYARMDGVAWVSSVPKKTGAEDAKELRFSQTNNLLILSWQAADGVYFMQSDDEGRSWDQPRKNSPN